MKRALLSAVVFLGLLPSAAQAQRPSESGTSSMKATKTSSKGRMAANGLRVSLIQQTTDLEMNVRNGDLSNSNKASAVRTFGASIGYAYLPVQTMGFTSNFAFLQLQAGGNRHFEMARLDMNAAYAFRSDFYVKGGINGAKFTNTFLADVNAATGFQIGLGVQPSRQFGIDISYVQMNQSGKFNWSPATVDLKEVGPEISITGTF